MNWKEVEGYQPERPLETDTESSPTTVYLRRNIREIPNKDMEWNDTEETHWIYEECEIKKEDFNVIAQAVTIENQNFQKEVLAEILLNQIKGVV